MDSGTLIFVIVFVMICTVLVVIINKNKSKKEKQLFQTLQDLAGESKCQISEHDQWRNSLIGIDKQANRLFYIRTTDEIVNRKSVSLGEIQKCRVINTNRLVTNNGSNYTVTDRIELTLTCRDSKTADHLLEFYNTKQDNLILNGELQLAEKWAKIVNETIILNSEKR